MEKKPPKNHQEDFLKFKKIGGRGSEMKEKVSDFIDVYLGSKIA